MFKPAKNLNAEITDILTQLEVIEKNRGEPYKAKAYRQAVSSLSRADKKISSGEEASKYDGVGKKIAKKIDEIIESGKLNKLVVELDDPKVKAMNELCLISGIGPKFAEKLVNEGVMSIDDLKKKKADLNHHQQIGLKYVKEFIQKIPREEMHLLKREIESSIKRVDKHIMSEVCGSYRRGKKTSGDIDILITQEKTSSKSFDDYTIIKYVVKQLQKDGLITDVISEGTKKFMGVCILPDSIDKFKPHLHRRIDIMFVPHDQYFPALLHFTGSGHFNNQIRSYAIEKGFHLNETALTRKGDSHPLTVKSEKDIFDYLGIDYLTPEERSL